MNIRYLTQAEDSPAILKGVLLALATGSTLIVFVLLMWLGVQREATFSENRDRIAAEQERSAAFIERDNAIRECNEQVGRAESARVDAENRIMAAVQAKNLAEARCEQYEQQIQILRQIQADSHQSFGR